MIPSDNKTIWQSMIYRQSVNSGKNQSRNEKKKFTINIKIRVIKNSHQQSVTMSSDTVNVLIRDDCIYVTEVNPLSCVM